MYINKYSNFLNLYNWITDSCSETPILITEKSDFFERDIKAYNDNKLSSISQMISYNYIYNYMYYLQKCIKELDCDFSLSNYKNIYEVKNYISKIDDIDLSIFMEWFTEEGFIKIANYIKSLESNYYSNEDMYNIMKYYNYLINNSLDSDMLTRLTFLTEGATDVFTKLKQYITKDTTWSSIKFHKIEINGIINSRIADSNELSWNLFNHLIFNGEDNLEISKVTKPANHSQALFYN